MPGDGGGPGRLVLARDRLERVERGTCIAGPTDSYAYYSKGHRRKPAPVPSDMPTKGEGGF